MKYDLPDKLTKPEYKFIVRGGFEKDYMLFNDYEQAFKAADSLSYKLGEPVFLYESAQGLGGEWKANRIMTFCDGHVTDEDDFGGIHYKYYVDAGNWTNAPEGKATQSDGATGAL